MNVVEHFRNARNAVSVPSGHVLFREREAGNVMYVLMDGNAHVIVHGTIVETAKPGALLGEMSLVDSAERSATVVTQTRCRLIAIEAKEFDLLIRETPAFARYVMKVMSSRLRR